VSTITKPKGVGAINVTACCVDERLSKRGIEMIKVTCVRIGTAYAFNRKLKGQFVRTFKDLYELSDWINEAFPGVCLVKPEHELTSEQLKWLRNRRRVYIDKTYRI
jgi:hypothetical protein